MYFSSRKWSLNTGGAIRMEFVWAISQKTRSGNVLSDFLEVKMHIRA